MLDTNIRAGWGNWSPVNNEEWVYKKAREVGRASRLTAKTIS